jgi:hypothetical protein
MRSGQTDARERRAAHLGDESFGRDVRYLRKSVTAEVGGNQSARMTNVLRVLPICLQDVRKPGPRSLKLPLDDDGRPPLHATHDEQRAAATAAAAMVAAAAQSCTRYPQKMVERNLPPCTFFNAVPTHKSEPKTAIREVKGTIHVLKDGLFAHVCIRKCGYHF